MTRQIIPALSCETTATKANLETFYEKRYCLSRQWLLSRQTREERKAHVERSSRQRLVGLYLQTAPEYCSECLLCLRVTLPRRTLPCFLPGDVVMD